jgi:hypothetical protein
MKQASDALIALLASTRQMVMRDSFTITLSGGSTLRYGNAPMGACSLVLLPPQDAPDLPLRLQLYLETDFSDSSGNFPAFDAHPGSTLVSTVLRCGAGSLHLPTYDAYAHLDSGGSPPNYGTDDGVPLPGDFTIKTFIYPETLGTISSRATVWSGRNVSDPFTTNYASFGIGSDGMYCRLDNTFIDSSGGAGTFTTGQWYEAEWSRRNGIISMKKDGELVGTTHGNSFVNDADSYGTLGYDPIQGNGFIGYLNRFSIWAA